MKKAIHPGKILKQKLDELNISVIDLATHCGLTPSNLFYIVKGARVSGANDKLYDVKIGTKLALKLADTLKTTPEFWLELQMKYNIAQERKTHKKLKPLKAKN